MSDFSDGYAKVKNYWMYGFINKEGKKVIPCIYENAFSFFEGYAYVLSENYRRNRRSGYINKDGVEYWED